MAASKTVPMKGRQKLGNLAAVPWFWISLQVK